MRTASATGPMLARCTGSSGASHPYRGYSREMAATGEREDPAFPVGAACRIDSRSPWRQVAEIPVGLDPETGRVFTADAHSDQVTIIDSASLEVETAVPVGGYPSGLTHVPEFRR